MSELTNSSVLVRDATRYAGEYRVKTIINENDDSNLQAFFEAIIVSGILDCPSPDDIK